MSSYSSINHAYNSGAEVLNIRLKRPNNTVSWGFNIQGGKEFSSPLLIQKITPNSLADRCSLKPGDYIIRIGNRSVENFTHNDARNSIIEQGNDLEIVIQRHAVPKQEDFVSKHNFNNFQFLTETTDGNHPSTKAPPQVNVQLKDNRVLATQSYNSPLGLYSKENVTNTLVETIKSLNLKVDDIESATVIQTPASHTSELSPSSLNNNFVQNFSNPPPSPVYQQPPVHNYQPPPPPPQSQPVYQSPSPPYFNVQPPYQQQYVPPPISARPQQQYVPQAVPKPTSVHAPPPPVNNINNQVQRNLNRGLKGSALRKLDHPTIPTCSACNSIIRGPFISAVGKIWCPNHFTCASCGVNLEDIGFIEENGKLYCEMDFEKYFAPRCAKCRKAIVGDCCYAVQKSYHPECFTCTKCNKKIASGGFHVEDGLPYCVQDYNQLFSAKCAGCNYPIDASDQFVEALNANWHVECFTCTTCHTKLEGIGFVTKSNKPYCKRHAR